MTPCEHRKRLAHGWTCTLLRICTGDDCLVHRQERYNAERGIVALPEPKPGPSAAVVMGKRRAR